MSITNYFKKQFDNPRNKAAFTTINILLGSGPLIIPQPYFRAGFFFSTIWTIFVFFLSYNSANYIVESIQLISTHQNMKKLIQNGPQSSSTNKLTSEYSRGVQQKTIKAFDHVEQFIYLYGVKWRFFPAISVSINLFGAAISKCILTAETLSNLFSDIAVLGSFQFWLAFFFLSGAAFSFKSIDKTSIVQAVIISARLLSISLMIIGAFIIIGQNNGIQDLSPTDGNPFFNINYFGDLFSNLIFSFMVHHSLPGITKQLSQIDQMKSFLRVSFAIAGISMLIIPITANMAFGNQLVKGSTGHDLTYYNEDFEGRLDFIYYIVSFYVFLNVAIFPVYIIVIRKSILSVFKPQVDSDKISKTTVMFSTILLLLVLVISFVLKDQIQIALNFTAGIFGCIILFFIPSLEVYKARKLFPTSKSFLRWTPIAIMIIGGASIIFNLYQTIYNIVT